MVDKTRKVVVKSCVKQRAKGIMKELESRLGTSESETLILAFMDYVKELSSMSETIHWRKKQD